MCGCGLAWRQQLSEERQHGSDLSLARRPISVRQQQQTVGSGRLYATGLATRHRGSRSMSGVRRQLAWRTPCYGSVGMQPLPRYMPWQQQDRTTPYSRP